MHDPANDLTIEWDMDKILLMPGRAIALLRFYKSRVDELLEANNRYLERARAAEAAPASTSPLYWFRPRGSHESVIVERAVTELGTFVAWGGGGCYLDGEKLDRDPAVDERSLAGAKAVAERYFAAFATQRSPTPQPNVAVNLEAAKSLLEKYDAARENQKDNGSEIALILMANYGDLAMEILRAAITPPPQTREGGE